MKDQEIIVSTLNVVMTIKKPAEAGLLLGACGAGFNNPLRGGSPRAYGPRDDVICR
jgi:hypothetical protein